MKPLNLDNRPCSPVSSNCVIWQGPTLDCINLCTGDTISDVMAKMAEELCTLLDQTNVDNYDLTCLGVTSCGPKDFQALIQLLIDKICELNNINPDGTKDEPACPDCVVTVAPCLREQDSNLPATMQLLDYVQFLANKICSIIDIITNLQIEIDNLNIRVTILEEATPPSFVIPSFTLACQIGTLTGTQFINIILQEFINNVWCDFYATTGTTTELSNAVQSICILDTDLQLTTGTPFLTNPNWIQSASYNTVADAINNIWVALCDVYNAVDNISLTVQDTNSIDLNYTGGVLTANIQDTGWKDLDGFAFYTGAMASDKPQCRRIGNQIHFRGAVYVPINNGAGAPVLLTGANTYNNVYRANPYVGAGGVIYDAESRILFNNTGVGAASVIPATVLDAGTNLDSSYSVPQLVATRKLDVETFVGSGITGAIQLTAAINVTILPNKTLRLSSLNVIEQELTDLAPFIGSSLLNGLTSNFTLRSWIINQRNHVRQIDGNMSLSQAPIIGLLGSGIVIGELYRIINYTPGDDFTNIGALLNADNQTFIATGITPTVWTGSQLIPLSSALHYDSFYNTLGPGYTGSQWPFLIDLATPDFDAARTNNLGGFIFRLDGLMAYVDPCTTDIKSYECIPP